MNKELSIWIEDFVNQYRANVEKLSNEEDLIIINDKDLRAPLQVDVLWIIDKRKKDKQFFFFYHNNNESDLKINVYGPYDVSIPDNSEMISQFINQEKFKDRYYYPNKSTTYSEILESMVIKALNKAIENPNKGFQSGSMFGTNTKDYLKIKFGRIQDTDFNIIAKKWITEIQRDQILHKTLSKQEFKSKEKGKIEGIGGFINPSIWIGEKPVPELSTKYKLTVVDKYIDIIINQNYKNRKIIVKSDGFISIFLRKEDSIPEEFPSSGKIFNLIKYLNEIFSILLLFDFNVISVESGDFSLVYYFPESGFLSESYKSDSYGESQFKKRFKNFIDYEFKRDYTIFPLENFQKVLRIAEIVNNDDKLGVIPVILLQSYSNIKRGEFSQSFLLGWTIIEYYINKLWFNHIIETNSLIQLKNYLKKCYSKFSSIQKDLLREIDSFNQEEETIMNNLNKITKLNIEKAESIEKIKEYLSKNRNITARIKLDMVYYAKLIKEEEYKLINNFRDKRNKFMHENALIDPSTSTKCYGMCLIYVKSLISEI